MIEYSRGAYGANLLLRWHGSALAKAFIPGLLSVTIYLLLHYVAHYDNEQQQQQQSSTELEKYKLFNHPYAIGVLVSSVSFLIIFRANYGYQRYWEACSTTTQFMSKWMDAAVFASVFHLQSQNNKGMKPPSFYDYDELNKMNLTRDREGMGRESFGPCSSSNEYVMSNERGNSCFISERSAKSSEDCRLNTNNDQESGNNHPTLSSSSARSEMLLSMRSDTSGVSNANSLRSHNSLRRRRYTKSINDTNDTRGYSRTESDAAAEHLDLNKHLLGPPRLDGGWGKLYQNEINGKCTATYYDIQSSSNKMGNKKQRLPPSDGKGFASTQGGRTPSLFLQELTHLSSLLVAVALSTLRNDMDDVESPLDVYTPGQTWPAVDPINLPKDVKHQAYEHRRLTRNIRYLLGMDQTKRSRTIYNAARPMLVLGGVSDNEIAFLQRARGPYAKTQLCWSWLSDFIIREHLAGSMGDVGPPIVSRLVQFLSDGMIYYNHARKIMFTPFPFPHAQLSAFFVLMMMVAIPFLMDQYANHVWLGATLTFLTVTCLAGLHEVARELENPFRNAPNDVPLCTLLAFYNEALITTFAGFHPDSYWDQADVLKRRKKKSSTATNDADGTTMKDDDPLLVPELPINGHGCGDERERPSSAIPQSTVDEIDINLKELREMIDSQALKIKELQARVQNKGRPQTAP